MNHTQEKKLDFFRHALLILTYSAVDVARAGHAAAVLFPFAETHVVSVCATGDLPLRKTKQPTKILCKDRCQTRWCRVDAVSLLVSRWLDSKEVW